MIIEINHYDKAKPTSVVVGEKYITYTYSNPNKNQEDE